MRPQLPAIGLGTAAIALVPEMDARATLDHALDRGIRYFDTAPLYGGGQAEIRLGQMLPLGTAGCRCIDQMRL
ncbi:aldo/keto reductase [Sinorhizobium medicae]|uniref:aldo/keto reductase n=1 Tax=Sinorhizobium medicae TaxID=110321 RepID=UPI00307FC91A